jgi:hypothetical protein
MKTRSYRFAGLTVEIAMDRELFPEQEFKLEYFRSDASADAHRFAFEKVSEFPAPQGNLLTQQANYFELDIEGTCIRYTGSHRDDWKNAYIRAEHNEKNHRILLREDRVPGRIPVKVMLEAMAAEHLIARNNGFIFHCSYIEHNGKAILFTAPSGTGKSTQAELWKNLRGAEIINGDRAAVRLAEGVLLAEGIPFAGSSEYCKNRSLPIEAIVYLGQAPTTSIRKVRGYEAFSKIWEGVSVNTWDKEDMELVSAVVQQAAERIPVYHLPCTPDESAVIALEGALRKQVNL